MSTKDEKTMASCRSWKQACRFRARRVEASFSVATRKKCGMQKSRQIAGEATDPSQCGAVRWQARERGGLTTQEFGVTL